MEKRRVFIAGAACIAAGILLASGGAAAQVQTKTIDGVVHVLNPDKPLNGTVKLEVERIRTINPYERPEVGMHGFDFARKPNGEVVLFDNQTVEFHRWSADGRYLGKFGRPGQGPGEFKAMGLFSLLFAGDELWISAFQKAARFDGNGRLLSERPLKSSIAGFLDPRRAIGIENLREPRGFRVLRLYLLDSDNPAADRAVDLMGPADVGSIRNPDGPGGLTDPWGTPRYLWAFLPASGKTLTALSTEYAIQVRNLEGGVEKIIERPHERAKISRSDIDSMYGNMIKQGPLKWLPDAYPDRYVSIMDIKDLPGGHFGVYRVTGAKSYEIDVFDAEGRFVLTLLRPDRGPFGGERYFEAGFALVDRTGDNPIYTEYRVKNLPAIFKAP